MTVAKNKRLKAKQPIPDFKTRQEEAEFWDTHDLADYWAELKSTQVRVAKGLLSVLQVEFDPETSAELFRLAGQRGLPATAMVQAWVLERLREEKGRKGQ